MLTYESIHDFLTECTVRKKYCLSRQINHSLTQRKNDKTAEAEVNK